MTPLVLIGGIGAGVILWYTGHRWRDDFLKSVVVFVAASYVIRVIVGNPSGWTYSVVALATAAAVAVLAAGWRWWVQRRRRPPRGGPSGGAVGG